MPDDFDEPLPLENRSLSGWQRLSSTFASPMSVARGPKEVEPVYETSAERGKAIKGMSGIEKRFGFISIAFGGLGFVFGLIRFVIKPTYSLQKICPTLHHCTTHRVSSAVEGDLLAVVQAVLLVVMYLMIRYNRRAPMAFATFLMGFSLDLESPIGIVLWVYAGWLLLRSYRIQRYGVANARAAAGKAAERSQTKRQAKARSNPKRGKVTPAKTGPTPNKRYTPKAPRRKPIPKAES